MYSLMGMVAGVTANFGPFCSKDLSSGISSFLESLITHLSWILGKVKEVNAVLKVLVVLEAIFENVVEDLEMRCLGFLIWVFLYCRNVFSLLLKMVFCRFVKVGSSSFCCRDVLVLAISVWMWLTLIFVHFILLWMSGTFCFLYNGLFKLIVFPFDLQGFWCYLICKASEVKNSCSSRFGKLYF